MNTYPPRRETIEERLREVLAPHVGASLTIQWSDETAWSNQAHSGVIVACEAHGLRLMMDSQWGGHSIPEWVATGICGSPPIVPIGVSRLIRSPYGRCLRRCCGICTRNRMR